MNCPQHFPVTESIKCKLVAEVRRKEEVFSIESDPLLASLVSCLGLQFEIGKAGRDRLSHPLGVDLSQYAGNPWESEIVTFNGEIGIRMWIPGHGEFLPRHVDFSQILHATSFDEDGKLSRIVIFPAQVARNYKRRGLELIIVRDWLLGNVLAGNPSENYLLVNEYELKDNTALIQCKLITRFQLAFFGTHDMADHLLGGGAHGMVGRQVLYSKIQETFDRTFRRGAGAKNRSLIISYLIGVLLDDCAQPTWYASVAHEKLLSRALVLLVDSERIGGDVTHLSLPKSFYRLVEALREDQLSTSSRVEQLLDLFKSQIFEVAA